MDYFSTLSDTQKANIAFITERMNAKGLTNPFTQAGILAVVSKESAFVPISEGSYRNTDNARIRKVFPTRLGNLDDAHLNVLKIDDEAFFNAVYGGMYGNAPTEGYKYRGRGFNQLTFKGNYKAVGDKIGVDLVNNPDALAQVPAATDALIQYFVDNFKNAPAATLAQYNTTGINDFKSVQDSTAAAYHANAGWKMPKASLEADPTGGRAKALSRSTGFLDMVKGYAGKVADATSEAVQATVDEVKKKPGLTIVATAVLLTGLYILITSLKHSKTVS